MRWSAGSCLALAALALAACGSDGPIETLSAMNPLKKEEQLLPGNRQQVLPGTTNLSTAAKAAAIGAPAALGDWSQPGGPASNNSGNLAGNLSGGRMWSTTVGAVGGGGMLSLGSAKPIRLSARPVTLGATVFVYDPTGGVTALSLANGGKLWSLAVRPEGESSAVNGGGVAATAGRVIVATGFGDLISLDAVSGGRQWALKIDGPARGAPTISDGKVYVMTQSGAIVAADVASGAKLWSAATGANSAGLLASASPAVSASLVLVPTGSGEIKALDRASGAVKWSASVAGGSRTSAITGLNDASASPVIAGDVAYATGVGGSTVAVSMASGEVVWSQPIGGADTPIVSGSGLFFLDLENRVVALDRASGALLWVMPLPPADPKKPRRDSWNGPVMVGGKLWLVSEDGRAAVVDAASGAVGSTLSTGAKGSIPPVYAGGALLVLGGDGGLVALN